MAGTRHDLDQALIGHGIASVLTSLFGGIAASLPLVSLAAVLFVVSWNMSEARHILKMVKRAPRGKFEKAGISELLGFESMYADFGAALRHSATLVLPAGSS